VFSYLSNELTGVEIGREDKGPNGTKEMNEREGQAAKNAQVVPPAFNQSVCTQNE